MGLMLSQNPEPSEGADGGVLCALWLPICWKAYG